MEWCIINYFQHLLVDTPKLFRLHQICCHLPLKKFPAKWKKAGKGRVAWWKTSCTRTVDLRYRNYWTGTFRVFPSGNAYSEIWIIMFHPLSAVWSRPNTLDEICTVGYIPNDRNDHEPGPDNEWNQVYLSSIQTRLHVMWNASCDRSALLASEVSQLVVRSRPLPTNWYVENILLPVKKSNGLGTRRESCKITTTYLWRVWDK